MEAASGGYHEVGRVLICKGADVNAAPVPSSKDTALTIAADKGHYKFVELILRHGSFVDVKNKKGNSPLWLACNGRWLLLGFIIEIDFLLQVALFSNLLNFIGKQLTNLHVYIHRWTSGCGSSPSSVWGRCGQPRQQENLWSHGGI